MKQKTISGLRLGKIIQHDHYHTSRSCYLFLLIMCWAMVAILKFNKNIHCMQKIDAKRSPYQKTFEIDIFKLFAFVPLLLLVYILNGKFPNFQYISIICISCITWNTNISNPTNQYIGISNRIYVSRKSFLAFDCHTTEFAEQLTLLFPAHPYSTPWKHQGVEKVRLANK